MSGRGNRNTLRYQGKISGYPNQEARDKGLENAQIRKHRVIFFFWREIASNFETRTPPNLISRVLR